MATPLAVEDDVDEVAKTPSTSTTRGTVRALSISNPSNAIAYVKLFDAAAGGSAPTPADTDADVVFGIGTLEHEIVEIPGGWAFAQGVWVAATTQAGQGASAPSASLVVQVWLA